MVEADAVEGVFEREHALDLMGLDHRDEDIAHGERGAMRREQGMVGGGGDVRGLVA